MMEKLGFSTVWVKWIMLCIKSVSYSVLLNGDLIGPIIPGRGLRQGDPLSPYLFILCVEGLSTSIIQAERTGLIHGCKVCLQAPTVSHFFLLMIAFYSLKLY